MIERPVDGERVLYGTFQYLLNVRGPGALLLYHLPQRYEKIRLEGVCGGGDIAIGTRRRRIK